MEKTEKKFNKIIKENNGLIYMVVNKYNISNMENDDLYQECLMKIWESMDKYDDEYKLSTYLYIILDNLLKNMVRDSMSQKKINHMVSNGYDIILSDIKNYDFSGYVNENDEYTINELDIINICFDILNENNNKDIIVRYLNGESQVDIANDYCVSRQRISFIYNEFINECKETLCKHGYMKGKQYENISNTK